MIPPEGGARPQNDRSGGPQRQLPAPCFDLRIERTDSVTYVELLGELDLSCEERFSKAVDAIHSGRLVLDLRGLTFIDSTGLRLILRTWQRSEQAGFTLELVGARDQVAKVLRITGLDDALPIVDQISLNGYSQHSNDH